MPSPERSNRLTRRDLLRLLATGGIGTLAACGGVAALLLKQTAPRVVIVSATAGLAATEPSPSPIAPSIVSRAEWGAHSPNHSAPNEFGFFNASNPFGWRVYDDLSLYRTLVIHHSVIYGIADPDTVREVQTLHMGDRGWADIGYHFLIGRSGAVYEGRDLRVRGTHVGGYNTGSAGICLLGNTNTDDIPTAQWNSLTIVCDWLRQLLPVTHLAGHSEFNADTECPGTRMIALLDPLATAVGLRHGTDGYEAPVVLEAAYACACGSAHL